MHKNTNESTIDEAYAKVIKQRDIKVGDCMLKVADYVRRCLLALIMFSLPWEVPFIVQEDHNNSYYQLFTDEG